MNTSVCCFAGHRNLPKDKLASIARNLDQAIESLVEKGVTEFISGGALGFIKGAERNGADRPLCPAKGPLDHPSGGVS